MIGQEMARRMGFAAGIKETNMSDKKVCFFKDETVTVTDVCNHITRALCHPVHDDKPT